MRLTPDHDALDVANKVRENIVVLTVDETLVVGRLDSSSHLVGWCLVVVVLRLYGVRET